MGKKNKAMRENSDGTIKQCPLTLFVANLPYSFTNTQVLFFFFYLMHWFYLFFYLLLFNANLLLNQFSLKKLSVKLDLLDVVSWLHQRVSNNGLIN
jgi:hypothetical protein